MRTALILALATITFATGIDAQEAGHCQSVGDSTGPARSGGMMDTMQEGMMSAMPASGALMRAMRLAPATVKALGDSLDLTADQITALDRLAEQSRAARRELMAPAKAAGEKLAELVDAGTPDTAAIRAAALDAFHPMAAMHAQTLVDAAAVGEILTTRQRALVAEGAKRSGCADHGGGGHR